jgi:uncharacterized membrane protein
MNGNLVPGKREVKIGDWFSEAMRLTTDNLGPHLLVGLILLVIFLVAGATVIGSLLLAVPMACGAFYFTKKQLLHQSAEIGDLFRGFDIFQEAVIANLIVGGICLGLTMVIGIVTAILVVIPSFIIGMIGTCCPAAWLGYLFYIPLLLVIDLVIALFTAMHLLLAGLLFDRNMKALEAVKLSYNFALANLWPVTLYSTLITAVATLGIVFTCGLGYLFFIPFLMYASTVVYRDWIGFAENESAPLLAESPTATPPAAP